MALNINGKKILHLIEKQVKVWEKEKTLQKDSKEKTKGMGPYIAISRHHGAGGTQIGQKLAKILNWSLYDQEVVEYIATEAQVRKSVVQSFDEKVQSAIETWVLTLLNRHALDKDHYLKHLSHVICSLAQHGNAIFIGRGARFILPAEFGLRVQITAPLPVRIKNVMARHQISQNEAKRLIERIDSQRVAYVRRTFHKDADDLAYFDLVINTATLTLEQATQLIIEALKIKLRDQNLLGKPNMGKAA